MSETPRTDELMRTRKGVYDDDFERGIALCRDLEREIQRKDALIKQMRQALKLAKNGLLFCEYIGVDQDLEEIEAALEAAEKEAKE